jgi:ABC-type phosphate transport system substrate-binding protein
VRKLRIVRRAAVVAGAVAVAVALTVPANAGTGVRKPSEGKGSGSDTTYNLMVKLDTLYNGSAGCQTIAATGNPQPLDFRCLTPNPPGTITSENYAHDVMRESYPLGSSVGITQLCQQGQTGVAKINWARSSRAPRASDCAGLRFVAYAQDGISWESFPTVAGSKSAGVTNLTQAQVQGIFKTCTITDWSQVGGSPGPIVVYSAQVGSGTKNTFDGFVGGNSNACSTPNHIIFENNDDPIAADGNLANAIFYYSYGRFQQHHNADAYLGQVDGVAPTPDTISDGTFPYRRFLYNVYRNTTANQRVSTAVRAYIGEKAWICKPNASHSTDPITGLNYGAEIQSAIESEGFILIPFGPVGGGVVGSSRCRVTPSP